MAEKKVIKGPIKSLNIRELSKDIKIIGDVVDSSIFSINNIEIYGNVLNSKIVSNSARISIIGKVIKSEIKGFSLVKIFAAENSIIESTFSSCRIENYLYNSTVKAFSIIENQKGNIIKSELISGMEINLYNVGKAGKNSNSNLKVIKKNSNNIFEVVFVHKQKINDLEIKLKELERYIKVLTIIKEKIETLPDDKRKEIKNKIEEYKKTKEYLSFIKEETRRLLISDPEEIKYNRVIIVNNLLYPPAKITIDGKETEINEELKQVAFYNSGIIIKGEVNKVYNKRKTIRI
ncbi:MAG TPA: hypothetical protein PKW55_02900 [Spirochaetota bacterium]|nr:hypothetical protein [Spirochaetota bacterium]HOM38202.1 hypothetical protein [Spirochaetota bacterium]HPQ48580.1 hypothetical protein [Spirochaetota bacterium]